MTMRGAFGAGRLWPVALWASLGFQILAAGCGRGASAEGQSPGPVAGAYSLKIVADPACALSTATLSFPMESSEVPGGSHPGVQVLLVGDSSGVEAELQKLDLQLRGGVGTRGDGALVSEGVRAWLHGIAEGQLTRAADGRGEVVTGKMLGYVALGSATGSEGSLGSCTAANHEFSLRIR